MRRLSDRGNKLRLRPLWSHGLLHEMRRSSGTIGVPDLQRAHRHATKDLFLSNPSTTIGFRRHVGEGVVSENALPCAEHLRAVSCLR